jgi:hypothetical protein
MDGEGDPVRKGVGSTSFSEEKEAKRLLRI